MRPKNSSAATGSGARKNEAEVVVFYIAPTVFFSADNWNVPMEDVFIRHLEDQTMILEHPSTRCRSIRHSTMQDRAQSDP